MGTFRSIINDLGENIGQIQQLCVHRPATFWPKRPGPKKSGQAFAWTGSLSDSPRLPWRIPGEPVYTLRGAGTDGERAPAAVGLLISRRCRTGMVVLTRYEAVTGVSGGVIRRFA